MLLIIITSHSPWRSLSNGPETNYTCSGNVAALEHWSLQMRWTKKMVPSLVSDCTYGLCWPQIRIHSSPYWTFSQRDILTSVSFGTSGYLHDRLLWPVLFIYGFFSPLQWFIFILGFACNAHKMLLANLWCHLVSTCFRQVEFKSSPWCHNPSRVSVLPGSRVKACRVRTQMRALLSW